MAKRIITIIIALILATTTAISTLLCGALIFDLVRGNVITSNEWVINCYAIVWLIIIIYGFVTKPIS